ncbi:MAG: CHAT domain-containing protein [Acidobacteriota bacterium]|nr:CHAT domain-containing protein [Blastocatellia bacterium]MDW8240577.1 CHAT domain-containing protein [Acidobacteriota bacterium]
MRVRTPVLALLILTSALTTSLIPGFSSGLRLHTSDFRPQTSDQINPSSKELLPGTPIEQELKGGEVHAYHITLAAGHYVRGIVDQRSIGVVLTLHGPDGQRVFPFYGPSSSQGPKEFSLVAELAGDYRLEVRPVEADAEPGRYEVKIQERREATAADKLFAEGQRLSVQGRADSLRQAIEKFHAARALWQAEGNRRGEAEALSAMGTPYAHVGQMDKALESFHEARVLWHEIGEQRREAYILKSTAFLYQFSDEKQEALDTIGQELSLWRAVGDREEEALALHRMGQGYYGLGELARAIDHYNKALPLYRLVKNPTRVAETLNDIGLVYQSLGQRQKALEYFNQALALHRNRRDAPSGGEAFVLTNIGLTYYSLGEPQVALQYLDQALQIRRARGFRREEAHTLHHIGMTYYTLGDLQKALEYLSQALELQQAVKHRRGEAYALNGLGQVYARLGEKSKALDAYHQALALFQTIADRYGQAAALNGMGAVYDELGKTSKALDAYQQALALRRAIADRSGEASTLAGLARVERNRGNLGQARTQMETALSIVESQRRQLVSPELRMSFLASKENYYQFYVDLLMQLHRQQPSSGYDAQALQANERARARSLLEVLTEARADIRQGVDPTLLEHERALQQRLNAKSERLTQLLSGRHTEEQKAAAEKEVSELLKQYQDVQAQIRASSPRYAALMQPQPLSVKEIQQQVLDDETLLLEYALGEERSYLWAVTPTSIDSYELPGRADIEAAAWRVYRLLVNRNEMLDTKAFARLSEMLLGAVADQLITKRLLIVTEGALQYIPFGALPRPVKSEQNPLRSEWKPLKSGQRRVESKKESNICSAKTDHCPLIVDHEIVTLPSASVLAALRHEVSGRPPAAQAVAVLADPVFETTDPRIKTRAMQIRNWNSKVQNKIRSRNRESESRRQSALGNPESEMLTRSARQVGLNGFPRLINTRREAEQIIGLTAEGQGLKAVDFAASKALMMNPALQQYQIIHLATHGLLNSEQPELSGVVFSLVNEQGQPQDGFVRLHDVFNLNLNADLVVLSACHTALGKDIKGEGLVGLTRGFMYAGAPRVVASLWEVEDVATARLMKRFYEAMLKRGLRPAEALREAQIWLLHQKRWQSPYYWSGFIFQGEWR